MAEDDSGAQRELGLEGGDQPGFLDFLGARVRIVIRALVAALTVAALGAIIFAKRWFLGYLGVGDSLTLVVIDWCFNLSVAFTVAVVVYVEGRGLVKEARELRSDNPNEQPGG